MAGFFSSLLIGNLTAQPRSITGATTNNVLVLEIEGKVEVSRSASAAWDPAYTNQVLLNGDRGRTDRRSRAALRMFDLSVVRIGERSDFQIESPPDSLRSAIFNILRGSIFLFHRDRPDTILFKSKTASAATRGTEFSVTVEEETGRMILTLFEGEAELRNALGTLRLHSGEQGTAEPGRPPEKTRVVEAVHEIQWCLYYPAVLDVRELRLDAPAPAELRASLQAYRSGNVLRALAEYPEDREPESPRERIYLAALLLAVGQVSETEALLNSLEPGTAPRDTPNRLADAIRLVIGAVKNQPRPMAQAVIPEERMATEWLAESYWLQSQARLDDALHAARRAAIISPELGFAWTRVAELEFSFGRHRQAGQALARSLELSPQNAYALTLQGFVLAARNRMAAAMQAFDQAIALDGAIGNAWLGRGLCRIRGGDALGGRQDLQTAVALEPQRAVLRSYLGKAFQLEGDAARASQELEIAREQDPNDPTAWLYSALLRQPASRINESVRDLERSKEVNKHRRVYRSRLLLDQDQAVRGANLANAYRDAGMQDVSVREATRAVNADYGNYSAHFFLANSFNELRDPGQVNLRYETAWFSEYLLANLLAPAGAGPLSQSVSQQEYTRLFEQDGLGLASSTEYFSNGSWRESAAQPGRFGNFSYALEAHYLSDNGQRFNNDQEQLTLSLQLKHQIAPQDSVYFQALYYDAEGGDLSQYYDPADANPLVRFEEKQEPLLLAGYHHEWSPGQHTLLLAARMPDRFELNNPLQPELMLYKANDTVALVPVPAFPVATNHYRSELEAYSVELQQIWQTASQAWVMGGRFQAGEFDVTQERLSNSIPSFLINSLGTTSAVPPVPSQNFHVQPDFSRVSLYGYWNWKILEPLWLTSGLSYDRLEYPANFQIPPVSEEEATREQWSPKAGFTWWPTSRSNLRGAYTRSLGGVSLDQSFRLEPVQVAGFNQAFRSLIPESVAGNNPAARFETFGLAADHRIGRNTYFGVEAEVLQSDFSRQVGDVDLTSTFPPLIYAFGPGTTRQELDFEERSLFVTWNQLAGEEWSFGARYRLSLAELDARFPEIPDSAVTAGNLATRTHNEATLHQLNLFAIFQHASGFFARFDSLWTHQSNRGYSPALPGDDFWQFNLHAGYRFFRRRAEVQLGVLNLTDQDYRLNPLNLSRELPRDRTFTARFQFNF